MRSSSRPPARKASESQVIPDSAVDMTAMQRNILFLIPHLRAGGAERVIVTLLKHLDRSQFRLSIGVVDNSDAVYLAEIPSDVEFIDLGASRVRYALSKIVLLIWKRRPDVVFSTLGHLNLAISMIRPFLPDGVRYIARETNIVSCVLALQRMPALWERLYRRFCNCQDFMVCQSIHMQDDLVERFGYPRERSVVINNPVDFEFIQRRAAERLDHSGFRAGSIRLVAAGRMVSQKGFDLLIDAIVDVANPRIHMVILGDGPLLEGLKRLAHEKGVAQQVEFIGFQSNPYAWFARADAFVLSSRFEGFPNVVLESLACGTPVIATPAQGVACEILDDIAGCVVSEEVSARSLAGAMRRWLAAHRNRIDSSVLAPYLLDNIIRRYQEVL